MAIYKKIPHPKIPGETTHLVMPAFSYATNTATADALAQIIIDAWASEGDPNGLQAKLLARYLRKQASRRNRRSTKPNG